MAENASPQNTKGWGKSTLFNAQRGTFGTQLRLILKKGHGVLYAHIRERLADTLSKRWKPLLNSMAENASPQNTKGWGKNTNSSVLRGTFGTQFRQVFSEAHGVQYVVI